MVCYIIPTAAGAVHYIWRGKRKEANEVSHNHLSLLFAGGAIFGIIDHWWNGELFLFGKNLASDLMLGVTITIATVAFWWIAIKAENIYTCKHKLSP